MPKQPTSIFMASGSISTNDESDTIAVISKHTHTFVRRIIPPRRS